MKFLVIIIFFTFYTTSLLACSCIGWDSQNVNNRYERSSVVMLGIPVTPSTFYSREQVNDNYFKILQKTNIRIIKSFKNSIPREMTIISEKADGSNCGVDFTPKSGIYLFFLSNTDKGNLEVNICDTALISPGNPSATQAVVNLL